MRPALFLDRDGVINKDFGYVYKIEDIEFIDSIFELVSFAKSNSYLVIIITNQAGIARGMFTEEDFHILNSWICKQFEINNGKIDKTYYCPYHIEGVIKKYKKNSSDRKPAPGMIEKACLDFDIDKTNSIFVGDKESDITAGVLANIAKPIYFGKNKSKNAYRSVSNLLEIKKEIILNKTQML
jgi:D-glycero-D-manno-heptose 1,7-bisphosphate phosphatase